MQARARQLKAALAQEALQLSQRRRAAAGYLRAAVESCLADLSMAGSRFDVRIGWEEHAKVGSLCVLLLGPAHAGVLCMAVIPVRKMQALVIWRVFALCWQAERLLKDCCAGTGLAGL